MMKMSALIVAAMFYACVCAAQEASWPELSRPPRASGGGENDAAVIVGAENYFTVEHVPGALQNAEDWQAYLTETRRVPSDKVTLLRDNEATLEKMRRYAKGAAGEVGAGGTLWFVFIGHGAPSKEGKDGLLVGIDAQQDPDSLYERSLSRGELLSLLGKGAQGKTVVLIDACFSGKSSSGAELVRGLQPLSIVASRPLGVDNRTILLTAAKSDQFAGPLPKADKMRPAFSYLVLGALRGWAADAQGNITASGVIDFARRALRLDHGRTQTPELAAGNSGVVLGQGREAAPDLAKIDRESSGAGGGGFTVSNLPAVPVVEAPKALDSAAASGLDFRSVDIDALQKYDAAFELDKGEAAPEEKAASWRNLAKDAPKFADLAQKRAAAWDQFAVQQKAADEAKAKRVEARDGDWDKLGALLALKVVPEPDKARWSDEFLKAYWKSPGVEPGMAKALAPHIAAGPLQNALKKLALAAPADAGAARGSHGRAGLAWTSIPGGSFIMGSSDSDLTWSRPQHRVTIKPFQMAKAPATFKQYRACVAAGACTPAHVSDGKCYLYDGNGWNQGSLPASFQGDDQPAVCVDWTQAKAFAQWAGGRLPSEAEWEYAARSAGKERKYPWGDEAPTCERAVMMDGGLGCGRSATWPVCSKPAGDTEQGLCDMGGNVRTWVQDLFHDSYEGAPTDGSAWEDHPASGHETERLTRGNAWTYIAGRSRLSVRFSDFPNNCYANYGIRPAR